MSDVTPSRPSADRNLLFGILALQAGLIGKDALISAMSAWTLAGQIISRCCALASLIGTRSDRVGPMSQRRRTPAFPGVQPASDQYSRSSTQADVPSSAPPARRVLSEADAPPAGSGFRARDATRAAARDVRVRVAMDGPGENGGAMIPPLTWPARCSGCPV
jgi:hypothetical protein